MTIRPDDDLPLGGSNSPSDPFEVDGVPATEGISAVGDADGLDEDPELQANRTDVEGSPTGHS